MSGKGSKPRPYSVDADTFASEWARIFGAKSEDSSPSEAKPEGQPSHSENQCHGEGNEDGRRLP